MCVSGSDTLLFDPDIDKTNKKKKAILERIRGAREAQSFHSQA